MGKGADTLNAFLRYLAARVSNLAQRPLQKLVCRQSQLRVETSSSPFTTLGGSKRYCVGVKAPSAFTITVHCVIETRKQMTAAVNAQDFKLHSFITGLNLTAVTAVARNHTGRNTVGV